MNVLVLGRNGQLATELAHARWPETVQVRSLDRPELDLARTDDIAGVLSKYPCDLLINAAAYTAVDRAETEPEAAYALNRDAPAALAAHCASLRIPLIHISTDYVFDGTKPGEYDEDDPVAPINVYGASKCAGEEQVRQRLAEHIIIRTSWLYSAHGHNFVKSMMRLAEQRDELRIVDDQHGCPTSAADLAQAIVSITAAIARGERITWGTYHYAGAGATTWRGFAEQVIDTWHACGGKRPRVVGIPTSEYPTPARRPTNSRLDCSRIARTFAIETRPWRESVQAVVRQCVAGEAREARETEVTS